MGRVGRQVRLLLWRDVLFRKRKPLMTFLELGWPVFIFLIVIAVRQGSLPKNHDQCSYKPLAMPSSGGLEFLQSFLCNIDNNCRNENETFHPNGVVEDSGREVMRNSMESLLMSASGPITNYLSRSTALMDRIATTMAEPEMQAMAHDELRVADFFHGLSSVTMYLTHHPDVLDINDLLVFMQSKIDIHALPGIIDQFYDLKYIVCDPEELKKILVLEPSFPVEAVSHALCNMDHEAIPELTRFLQNNVDMKSVVERIKSLLATTPYGSLADIEDPAAVIDLLLQVSQIVDLDTTHPELSNLVGWVQNASEIANGLEMTLQQVPPVMEILNSPDGNLTAFYSRLGLQELTESGIESIMELGVIFSELSRKPPPEYVVPFHEFYESVDDVAVSLHTTYGLTADEVNRLLATGVGIPQLLVIDQLLQNATSASQYRSFMCVFPGLKSLFLTNTPDEELVLQSVQNTSCALNITLAGNPLTYTEDVLTFMDATLSPVNMTAALSLSAVSAVFGGSDLASTLNDFVPFLDQLGGQLGALAGTKNTYGGSWAIVNMLEALHRVSQTFPNMEKVNEVLTIVLNRGTLDLPVPTNSTVAAVFQDLLLDSTSTANFMVRFLEIPPAAVNALLESLINVNMLARVVGSQLTIKDIVCDVTLLGQFVLFSTGTDVPVDLPTLSRQLCGSIDDVSSEAIARSIDLGGIIQTQLIDRIPAYLLEESWWYERVNLVDTVADGVGAALYAVNLVNEFMNGDFNGALQDLTSAVGMVVKHIPGLDGVGGLLESLGGLLNLGTSFTTLLNDVGLVSNAVLSLGRAEPSLLFEGTPNEFMNDPQAMRTYFGEVLHVPPEVTNALLTANISFSKVLTPTDLGSLAGLGCVLDGFKEVLHDGSDSASVDRVIAKLCNMDMDQAVDFAVSLVPDLDIGPYVKHYFDLSPSYLLEKANLTTTDIQDMADLLAPLHSQAAELGDVIKSTYPEQQSDSFEWTVGTVSQLFCGDSALNTVATGSGFLNLLESELDNTFQLTEGHLAEMEELDSEFCRDAYIDIQRMGYRGSLIWYALKPLFRGQILYAPDNDVTRDIMAEVNSFAGSVHNIHRVTGQWLESVRSLNKLSDTIPPSDMEALLDTLSTDVISDAMDQLFGQSGKMLVELWRDGNGVNLTSSELGNMMAAANVIYNVTGCFDIRVHGVPDEDTMVEASAIFQAENRLLAGIVFLNADDEESFRQRRDTGDPQQDLKTHIKYKIRMDSGNVRRSDRLRKYIAEPGPEDDFFDHLRYLRGFTPLQDLVERGIIRHLTGEDSIVPEISLQQMPYPCWQNDDFLTFGSFIVAVLLVFSYLCIYAMSIAVYVAERENQIVQTMQVMGLSSVAAFLAWFLRTLFSMLVMSTLATLAIVYGQLLIYSDPTVFVALLLCYSLAVTMQAYLVSVFFKRTTVAVLVGVLWYLVSIMPYIMVYNAEYVDNVSVWMKILMCLCATSAFTQTAIEAMYAEQMTFGLQWGGLTDTVTTNFPPLYGMIMLLADAAIYGVLAWFCYNVFYGPHGAGQPVYFLFTREYWGFNKNKRTIHYTDFGKRKGQDDNESVPGEPEPDGLPVGITLRGLTKTYKKQPRPAVNGINVNFFQGQVTAFLGHNGAGKTSTINMLTGNSSPSSGLAFINGRDVKTDMSEIRQDMGVCPQYDILCDYMTVEEHLDFYACLKGRYTGKERKEAVKGMLVSTGLYDIREARVGHLSGGQRRRLSIGVAFIGDSRVILLDEPTSGVDPAARRSIWDVVTKNRDGRTILLSTHHLDEAEIIGDRILIIHRGQVLCMGSPMFLKSYFGSGYHLTVAKNVSQRDDVSNNTLKEKSVCKAADVLDFIRQHVPSARLVEEIGTEMTFVLPPCKRRAESMRNLFRRLEEQQESLNIHKYGVSDTPLEEIFLKVTTLAEQGQLLDPNNLRQWVHQGTRRKSTDSSSTGCSLRHLDESSENASDLGSLRGYRQRNAFDDGSSIGQTTQLSRADRSVSRDMDLGIPSMSSSRLPSYTSGSRRESQADSQSLTNSDAGSSGFHMNDSQESLIRGSRRSDIPTCSSDSITKKSSLSATPPNGSLYGDKPRTYTGGVKGELRSDTRFTGRKLAFRQFRALLTKRFFHNVRNPRNYFAQLLLPAIFVIAAMLGSIVRPRPQVQEPSFMTPTIYSPNVAHVLRMEHPSDFAERMASTLTTYGVGTACMSDANSSLGGPCIRDSSSSLTYKLTSEEENRAIAAQPSCHCDEGYQECPPGAGGPPAPFWTTRSDDQLYDVTNHSGSMEDYILRTHVEFNSPQTRPRGGRNGGWSFDVFKGNTTARVWYNNRAWHALPGYLNSLNNMILRANAPPGQQHQYGITLINEPFPIRKTNLHIEYIYQGVSDSGVVLILMAAMCFLPSSFTTYLVLERAGKQKRLQHICGVSACLYWCTTLLWDMLTYIFMTGLLVAIVIAFQVPLYVDRANLPAFIVLVVLFGWATTPLMYLLSKFFKDANQSYMVLFLFNMFIGLNSTATTFYFGLPIFSNRQSIVVMREVLTNMFLVTPQYCLGEGLLRLARNQFIYGVFSTFKLDTYQNPFTTNMLFWHYITLLVEGCLFFALVLVIETKVVCKRGPSKIKQAPDYKEDSDVSLERQRVVTGEAENEALVLYNLTKVYLRGFQKVRAVDHLCLGIGKGECFGLLGINGAGKTTTFKMITGDLNPSAGAALMEGRIISEDAADMQQEVGYCPQMDSLDPMLTGQETLEFFCRLKGMPEEDVGKVVDAAIQKFNLGDHRTKKTCAYSAGNKRKLSAAIALLGEPQLVLMDEPTTGMDPGTRRLVWDNILSVIKDNRSVILTSHSMAECDALCTRMAIMVNGSFMCLGNSQHLKDKFGTGYTTIIRAGGDPPNIAGVISFMQDTFPGSIVKDRHLRQLEFAVPPRGCQLSSLFGAMEDQKRTGLVEDYSVSQTTLDQVFLHFARHQNDSRIDDLTPGKGEEDDISIISGSHMSSLLSVVSKHKELRSRNLGGNLTLPVSKKDDNTISSSNFNLERWAYNIPPNFLVDMKSGPKSGKAAKTHLQEVLSKNLPSEAKHLPPLRLAQYLGPDVCKTLQEKAKKYRQGKRKQERHSATKNPSATPSIAPSVTPSDLPSVAPSDSISAIAVQAAIRESKSKSKRSSQRTSDVPLV